jgi:hypothetical protein
MVGSENHAIAGRLTKNIQTEIVPVAKAQLDITTPTRKPVVQLTL